MARAYKVYGGLGSGIRIKDDISPQLQQMAYTAPLAFAKAAHRAGFRIQKEIKEGIRKGIIGGQQIPSRKTLTAAVKTRHRKALRKFKKAVQMRPNYHLRNSRRFTGGGWGGVEGVAKSDKKQSLMNAIGFEPLVNGAMVGWLSRSAPMWGLAVQEARRGGRFGHVGKSLPNTFRDRRGNRISDKQRRYLNAIGIGVKKGTTHFRQKPFDLMGAYAPTIRKWINPFMTGYINYYLNDPKGQAEMRKKIKIAPYSVVKAPVSNRVMYNDRQWYAAS